MKRYLPVAVAATALVTMAACSSAVPTASDREPVAGAASPFGTACVPGGFDASSKVPVVTAAAGDPALSTLVTAVTKAGLGDTLNGSTDITVFAPDNEAFAKIPAERLNRMLADNAELTRVLTYHVVPGRLTPSQLPGTHRTLEGGDVTVTGGGPSLKVNDANIVCGDLPTANATVYVIDSVLMPG